MVSVSPMDKHGYFNYSVNTGVAGPIVQNADVVIVEVNEHMPKIHGGYGECIHVSEVDYIVEGKHEPLRQASRMCRLRLTERLHRIFCRTYVMGQPCSLELKYAQCSWRADSRN